MDANDLHGDPLDMQRFESSKLIQIVDCIFHVNIISLLVTEYKSSECQLFNVLQYDIEIPGFFPISLKASKQAKCSEV